MLKRENLTLVLRVTPQASTNLQLSPAEVVNHHWEKFEKNGAPVYFSTNARLDVRKKNKIHEIILFSTLDDFLVRADVVKIVSFKNGGLPEDLDNENFVKEFPQDVNTWILLENFEEIDADELKKYETLDGISLEQQIERPRFAICYSKIKEEK